MGYGRGFHAGTERSGNSKTNQKFSQLGGPFRPNNISNRLSTIDESGPHSYLFR